MCWYELSQQIFSFIPFLFCCRCWFTCELEGEWIPIMKNDLDLYLGTAFRAYSLDCGENYGRWQSCTIGRRQFDRKVPQATFKIITSCDNGGKIKQVIVLDLGASRIDLRHSKGSKKFCQNSRWLPNAHVSTSKYIALMMRFTFDFRVSTR